MPFIAALQRRWSNQIGFLSNASLRTYALARNIWLAEIANRPIGYLLARPSLAWQPSLTAIVQLAIHPDYHGIGAASHLLAHLTALAAAAGRVGIQAICRANLPANTFWAKNAFVHICYLTPPNARKKPLIVWRLPLTKKLPIWFASPPARAGTHGKRPRPATRKGVLYVHHDPHRWILPKGRHPKTKTKKTPPRRRRLPLTQRKSRRKT